MFVDEESALALERLAWLASMSDVDLLFWLTTSLLPEMMEESEGGVRALFAAARNNSLCELGAAALRKSDAAKQVLHMWDDGEVVFLDDRTRQAITQVLYTPPILMKGRVQRGARFRTAGARVLATRNPSPVRIVRVA